MNNYILVKLDYCWADEFNVNAFWVTTEEEFNKFTDLLSRYNLTEDEEFYFGTNEFISFGSSQELVDSLKVEIISKEYYENLLNSFGSTYGLFDITRISEHIEYELETQD